MKGIILGFALILLGMLSFFAGVSRFEYGCIVWGIVLLIIAMGVFIGSILS